MQVCTSLQKDNHASTPTLCFYRPGALPAAQPTATKQWRQSKCKSQWKKINRESRCQQLLLTIFRQVGDDRTSRSPTTLGRRGRRVTWPGLSTNHVVAWPWRHQLATPLRQPLGRSVVVGKLGSFFHQTWLRRLEQDCCTTISNKWMNEWIYLMENPQDKKGHKTTYTCPHTAYRWI